VVVGGNAGKDLKMKNLFSWKFAAGLLGMATLIAATAAAQAPAIRADVPFAFTIADQTLPAGAYRFSVELDHKLVRITDEGGKKVWLARIVAGGFDRAGGDLNGGLLRFDRHGDRYLLSGVWRAGAVRGSAVMPSRLPRELAKSSGVRDVQGTR
jgi:hypothetical protein